MTTITSQLNKLYDYKFGCKIYCAGSQSAFAKSALEFGKVLFHPSKRFGHVWVDCILPYRSKMPADCLKLLIDVGDYMPFGVYSVFWDVVEACSKSILLQAFSIIFLESVLVLAP